MKVNVVFASFLVFHQLTELAPRPRGVYNQVQMMMGIMSLKNRENQKKTIKDEPKESVPYPEQELLQAINKNQYDRAKGLLEAGVTPNARINEHFPNDDYLSWDGYGLEYTALHAAVSNAIDGRFVELLFNYNAHINAQDTNGATALHYSARLGKTHIVSFLIEKGADINARDKNGSTALHEAAAHGHDAIVALLLEKNALLVPDNKGRTPLHTGVFKGHLKTVELLIKSSEADEAKTIDQQETLTPAS